VAYKVDNLSNTSIIMLCKCFHWEIFITITKLVLLQPSVSFHIGTNDYSFHKVTFFSNFEINNFQDL